MLPPARATAIALLTVATALALVATGCGSSDSSETAATTTADPADFPQPDNQTLEEVAGGSEASDLVIAPTQSVFVPGENRYGFGVFTVQHDAVDDADLALYAAPADGGKAVGPFPATIHSLATPPAYASKTTTTDPDAAKYFYTSQVDFKDDGTYNVIALIRDDDGSHSYVNVGAAKVGNSKDIPMPGNAAPIMHTPTAEDVGGDLTKIDTRQPPDTMHDVDYADALGKEPIALLFATPALCQSRVCGPVVDIMEEVKDERPDDAAFIHMEVYNDNDPNKGVRPQLQDFNLMTEPWLFVIDSDGKISTVIEGAFSKQELEDALDKADQQSGVTPGGDS